MTWLLPFWTRQRREYHVYLFWIACSSGIRWFEVVIFFKEFRVSIIFLKDTAILHPTWIETPSNLRRSHIMMLSFWMRTGKVTRDSVRQKITLHNTTQHNTTQNNSQNNSQNNTPPQSKDRKTTRIENEGILHCRDPSGALWSPTRFS